MVKFLVLFMIIPYKPDSPPSFLLLPDQIQDNKIKSSHIHRNNIQNLALRCQGKRKALWA